MRKREGEEAFTLPLAFGHAPDQGTKEGAGVSEREQGRRLGSRERGLLFGGTAREILARLLEGDPLQIRALVAHRLRARCLLMDGDRAHLRALALCARHARHFRGQPSFSQWLRERVDAAIDALLVEESERVGGSASAGEGATEAEGVWSEMAPRLGLSPVAMRGACANFNCLDPADRQAFFELVLDGRNPDEWARASGLGVSELARRARRGLDCVLAGSAEAEVPEEKT